MRFGKRGFDAQRLLPVCYRFRHFALIVQHASKEDARINITGVDSQRLFEVSDRIAGLTNVEQGNPQLVVCPGVVGGDAECLFVIAGRLLKPAVSSKAAARFRVTSGSPGLSCKACSYCPIAS